MAIKYQHDANGYYVGEIEDYGGPLPHNSVEVAPEIVAGHVPQWIGDGWQQVESHVGKSGYVNGSFVTIDTPGPLPDGWTDEFVDPRSDAEKRIEEIDAELRRLDSSAARPSGAVISRIVAGEPVDPNCEDAILLAHIEGIKEALREERKTLI